MLPPSEHRADGREHHAVHQPPAQDLNRQRFQVVQQLTHGTTRPAGSSRTLGTRTANPIRRRRSRIHTDASGTDGPGTGASDYPAVPRNGGDAGGGNGERRPLAPPPLPTAGHAAVQERIPATHELRRVMEAAPASAPRSHETPPSMKGAELPLEGEPSVSVGFTLGLVFLRREIRCSPSRQETHVLQKQDVLADDRWVREHEVSRENSDLAVLGRCR
jgi:hypothetical protein